MQFSIAFPDGQTLSDMPTCRELIGNSATSHCICQRLHRAHNRGPANCSGLLLVSQASDERFRLDSAIFSQCFSRSTSAD